MNGTDLWKAVHTIIGTNTSNPIMNLISQFENPNTAASIINNKLASVFLPASLDPAFNTSCTANDWNIGINVSMVLRLLRKLPTNKSTPDMPSLLYKRAAIHLADPLCKLFRQSIRDAEVRTNGNFQQLLHFQNAKLRH